MSTRKKIDRIKAQASSSRNKRDKGYIAQYVERPLYERIAVMAAEQRRTVCGMVNAVLAFGLAMQGDRAQADRCGVCLNRAAAKGKAEVRP